MKIMLYLNHCQDRGQAKENLPRALLPRIAGRHENPRRIRRTRKTCFLLSCFLHFVLSWKSCGLDLLKSDVPVGVQGYPYPPHHAERLIHHPKCLLKYYLIHCLINYLNYYLSFKIEACLIIRH